MEDQELVINDADFSLATVSNEGVITLKIENSTGRPGFDVSLDFSVQKALEVAEDLIRACRQR